MKRLLALAAFAVGWLSVPPSAQADLLFQATLTGAQQPSPVETTKSGTATLRLNDAQDRLEMMIELFGFDLDGNQTVGDTTDDVTGLHIHRAPAGAPGSVVFGLVSPNSDANGDLVIDAAAGTLISAWDASEGNGTTLTDELTALFSDGLYFNVHTMPFAAGEIRGQITAIPEPSTFALASLAAVGLMGTMIRRRSARPTSSGQGAPKFDMRPDGDSQLVY